MIKFRQKSSGFTLIEVLVAIAIIGILTGFIGLNFVSSGQQSRDAKRQSDIRTLQAAVELYKNKHGRYPEQCVGGSGGWSGQLGTIYECNDDTNRYILGNELEGRLFGEFMPQLPIDPRLNGDNSGYVYRTNANGTVYKIMAMRTVESESVDYYHEFKSCFIIPDSIGRAQVGAGVNQVDEAGWCIRATAEALDPSGAPMSIVPIPQCRMSSGAGVDDGGNGRFEITYGVWGGFEAEVTAPNRALSVRNTTRVICK